MEVAINCGEVRALALNIDVIVEIIVAAITVVTGLELEDHRGVGVIAGEEGGDLGKEHGGGLGPRLTAQFGIVFGARAGGGVGRLDVNGLRACRGKIS